MSATCFVNGNTLSATYVRRVINGDFSIKAVGGTAVAYAIGYNLDAFLGHETAQVWRHACGEVAADSRRNNRSEVTGWLSCHMMHCPQSANRCPQPASPPCFSAQVVNVDFAKGTVESVGQPPIHLAHGSLNGIAWAVLLPLGVLLARFSKHKLPGRVSGAVTAAIGSWDTPPPFHFLVTFVR